MYYGWGVAALDPPMPVVRYQRRPGELLHLDTKKLERIAGISHRTIGRCKMGIAVKPPTAHDADGQHLLLTQPRIGIQRFSITGGWLAELGRD